MKLNPHISVDCVIFGFDGEKLKILLLKRNISEDGNPVSSVDYKLPGNFISDEEDLNTAANRVLKDLTGLENIYLKQFKVFGKPDRVSKEKDLKWLHDTTGLPIRRVVTVAYYSLIEINRSKIELTGNNKAEWVSIEEARELAFDHNDILNAGLSTLRTKLQFEPVGMELLPEKFTLRQLQTLYEIILSRKLDNRNFRKKVLKVNYLTAMNEKEKDVAHKPAQLYSFNKELYLNNFIQFEGFQF
ncbi:MAG: NUDIX domain-containing protein [Bacteroidales bacterium]|nr:NUDIX domain-containing protein [Bacteroidales bacterium]MCF8392146.1 NUDIX domain-containing protein [Bacteroidales bacterium]